MTEVEAVLVLPAEDEQQTAADTVHIVDTAADKDHIPDIADNTVDSTVVAAGTTAPEWEQPEAQLVVVHSKYLDFDLVQPLQQQQAQRVGFAKQALLLEQQPGFALQELLDSQPVVLEVALPVLYK